MRIKVKMKNTQFTYRKRYANYVHIPEFDVYQGTVVEPKPSWLTSDQFMLTTGDHEAPVRILDKRDIVEAWIDRSKSKDNVSIIDKYVVTAGPLNRYSCTCTAYKYRRWCSHINEVKKAKHK